MKVFKVCAAALLGVAIGGCWSRDNGGTAVTPDAVAGLRFINLVSDTSALNFRVVDVVNNAPNTIGATFRTGGAPYGVVTTLMPPYFAVDAGQRHIKVFLSSTVDTLATQVLMDTVYTFAENNNYTFYLYGSARAGTVGHCCSWLVTKDSVPTIAANKMALRVLDLAPALTGNIAGSAATSVDARVGATNSAVPVPVTAGLPAIASNIGFGQFQAYSILDTSGTATPYRVAVTANGTTSPVLFQGVMPLGIRGTALANPISGSAVGGSAFTAIIVPRSTPGSLAPQTAAAAVTTNIDSITRSNDTVTVWRHITPGNGTSSCATAAAVGVAAGDNVNTSGLTQPEYNGSQTIASITAGVNQTLDTARQTVTLTGGTAGSTFKLTFLGQTTSAIAFDETAATVQAALAALTSINGVANVNVTGPAGGPYVVVFRGTFLGTNPVAAMTTTVTGTVTAAVTTNFNCLGAASPARFRYRITGVPVSPATGALTYRIITPTNDFTQPTILFVKDADPPRTAP